MRRTPFVARKAQRSRQPYLDATIPAWEDGSPYKRQPVDQRGMVNRFSGWVYACAMLNAKAIASVPLRLYAQALKLTEPEDPDYDIEGAGINDLEWGIVLRRAGALPSTYYRSVSEPYDLDCEDFEIGDLADDVADIYRDLSEGLSLLAAGHHAEAQWEFVFSFRSHWGRHAADAIQALHCWIEENSAWEPSS